MKEELFDKIELLIALNKAKESIDILLELFLKFEDQNLFAELKKHIIILSARFNDNKESSIQSRKSRIESICSFSVGN